MQKCKPYNSLFLQNDSIFQIDIKKIISLASSTLSSSNSGSSNLSFGKLQTKITLNQASKIYKT